MARIASIKATLNDAGGVRTVWEAHPGFTMGSVSLNDFIAVHDAVDELDKDCAKKDVELTGVKANRDDKARHLGELITHFRSGMRSTYGPDSPEYEQAGCTRASARKPPTRKGSSVSNPPAVTGA